MFTAAGASKNGSQQVSDALSVLDKAVLEMIMAQEPLLSVLERLCTRIEDRLPGSLCSTLLPDRHKGVFCQAAGPSLPRSYLDYNPAHGLPYPKLKNHALLGVVQFPIPPRALLGFA